MPQITVSKSVLKRMKVMLSEDLKDILRKMEAGCAIWCNGFSNYLSDSTLPDGEYPTWLQTCQTVSARNICTLESAGMIEKVEHEDYVKYILAYDPKERSIDDGFKD
jgi:hypothetical protein